MREDRRKQLLDAATQLIAEASFQDLLGAITVEQVTERAGVTSGSFFHHFRNRERFAEAVADRLVEDWARQNAEFAALIDDIDTTTVTSEAIHTAAVRDWEIIDSNYVAERESLLWATHRRPISTGTARTGADLLADLYRELLDATVPHYRRLIIGMGREMLPPFTPEDLSVALTALVEGLHVRHCVDPEHTSAELFGDLVLALLLGTTRPRTEQTHLHELQQALTADAPSAPATTETDDWWSRVTDAAVPLFESRHPDKVKMAEIAAAAGLSASRIYHRFGSVRAVAAATFARHLPELEELSTRPLDDGEGPERRIEQVLLRLIEVARANRGVTEAVLDHMLRETGPDSDRASRSIRDMLPLAGLVAPHCRALREGGMLRPRIDSQALASSLISLSMVRVLTRSDDDAERIVDDTSDLILRGALAR
jgi:AcrR family transcriptional regulator